MTLPEIPEGTINREYLRIGGGYGSAAAGSSPAGGLDVDNSGNLATDGDITTTGNVDVDGRLDVGDQQTIETSNNTPLVLRRNVNSVWSKVAISLEMKNDNDEYVQYGEIRGQIENAADGSEKGRISIGIIKDGVFEERISFNALGVQIHNLPTSNPGGTGNLWNNGGTLCIT